MAFCSSSNRSAPRRLRGGALAVALWLFSLSTTVLLVGMWGRAVASDGEAIAAGARAVLESDVVAGRLTEWIADGISRTGRDLPDGAVADTASAVWDRPETQTVIADGVSRIVSAALAPPGDSVSIEISEVLRPLTPVVVEELALRGIAADAAIIDSALQGLPTVVLDTEAELGVVSAVSTARAVLTRVVAVALLGMALGGAFAVGLADDRMRQLRGLAIRVVVSAMTFALLLRISAWALDPGRGRSPLAAGGSALLSSSLHVLVMTAAIAAGVGFFATVEARRRRRAAAV